MALKTLLATALIIPFPTQESFYHTDSKIYVKKKNPKTMFLAAKGWMQPKCASTTKSMALPSTGIPNNCQRRQVSLRTTPKMQCYIIINRAQCAQHAFLKKYARCAQNIPGTLEVKKFIFHFSPCYTFLSSAFIAFPKIQNTFKMIRKLNI